MSVVVRILVLVALLLAGARPTTAARRAAPSASAAPAPSLLDVDLYQVDSAHSSIEFAVPWMGLTKVKGTFTDVRGSIGFDPHDVTRSSVTIVIQTPSLTTWHPQRDKDLRSPAFFDVGRFPTATFSSRGIERSGDGYLVHGTLTIKGNARDVDVPFSYLGEVVDSGGTGHRLGFEGRLAIARQDFGVTGFDRFNRLTSLGQRMIGDQVDLLLSIQGWMWTPTELRGVDDSLYRAIVERGMDEVTRNYHAQRAHTPDTLMAVNEDVMNSMGYHLIRQHRPQDAVRMFALEAEAYPGTAFPQVGLGQAYATLGNRDLAIASCEKAVALNPGATRALEILRRLRQPAVQ